MRIRFGIGFGLITALLLGSGAAAQSTQWTYIGPPDLFTSASDFPDAQVCVQSGWTPGTSGIPSIAAQWRPLMFETFGELQTAIANFGQCDIAVIPGDALATRPQLLALAQSQGLADMTQALMAADGNAAGQADGAPPLAFTETADVVIRICGNYLNYSLAMDCACLGGAAVRGLEDGTFPPPKNSANGTNRAGLTILQALTRDGAPQACMNEQDVAAHIDGQAEEFGTRMQAELDRAGMTLDQYRACVLSEGMSRYRAERGASLMTGSNEIVVDAMTACLGL